ncbi:MAG: hypothetical protein KGL39_56825, partial [Patescibacteria group bacterium]|nr:hypothetical protein [Patescibacteria group bacterium]
DANWLGYYDFLRTELGLKEQTEKLLGLTLICKNAGWFLPHKNICWICERPQILHRNSQGRLHKDGGPALQYPDGFSIFALNGIRMDKKFVETPAEQLDPGIILKKTNADIRRELIRKVGIERMLTVLPNKVLDRRGNYELLSIELDESIKDARYLKMLNPSIGTWHLEGVDPQCSTVESSLNWRNQQKFVDAEILT